MATSNQEIQEKVNNALNTEDLTDDVEIELEASDDDGEAGDKEEINPNVTDQLKGAEGTLSVQERWNKVVEADPELKNYQSDDVKARVGKLTYNWREQERQTAAALEYAEGTKKENDLLKAKQHEQQGTVIVEHVARLEADLASANKEYEDAFIATDPTAIANANAKVARISSLLANANTQQSRFKRSVAPVADTTPVADRVNQQVRTAHPAPAPESPPIDAKAEAWAGRNTWFGEDEELTTSALTIHKRMVTQEGYLPASDAYYEELDNRLKRNFPNRTELGVTVPTSGNNGAARAATVAGVGNQMPAGTRSGPKKIKLTASQVQIAKRLGVSLTDYAKQVANLNRG